MNIIKVASAAFHRQNMASSESLKSFHRNFKMKVDPPPESSATGKPTRARSSSCATLEGLKSFSENFVLKLDRPERRSMDLSVNLGLESSENGSVQSTVLELADQNGRHKQAPDTLKLKKSPVHLREAMSFASAKEKKKKRKRPPSVSAPSFEDKYELSNEVLGSGAFAVVKTCFSKKDHLQLAAKLIEKGSADVRPRVLKEVEILYKCKDHPNILQLKDYFETGSHFYLVFEKMEGGPLLGHIQHQDYFTEQQASLVVCDVASALAYLHAKGIAHRDLKPENLLCSDMDHISPVKICDFDLSSVTNLQQLASQQATTPMLYTPVGSAEFMAPEVVETFTGDAFAYDKKCDLWSLGVTLYIMLSGYPPFYGRCGNECGWDEGEHCVKCQDMLMERIQDGRYEFPAEHWSQVSTEAKDLISHLLVKEVDQRYTAIQVLDHSWVQERAPKTPLDTPRILSRNPSMTMEVAQFAARSIAFHRTDSAHTLSRQGSCELMDDPTRRSSGLEGDSTSSLTRRTNELRLSSPDSSELATRRVKSRNSDEAVESKTVIFSIAD